MNGVTCPLPGSSCHLNCSGCFSANSNRKEKKYGQKNTYKTWTGWKTLAQTDTLLRFSGLGKQLSPFFASSENSKANKVLWSQISGKSFSTGAQQRSRSNRMKSHHKYLQEKRGNQRRSQDSWALSCRTSFCKRSKEKAERQRRVWGGGGWWGGGRPAWCTCLPQVTRVLLRSGDWGGACRAKSWST